MLVTITKSNEDNQWQLRKVNVEPSPKDKLRTWHEAMRAKQLEAIKYSMYTKHMHLNPLNHLSFLTKTILQFVPVWTESVLVNSQDVKIWKTPKTFQNVLIGTQT